MINAKEEVLEHVDSAALVMCAQIRYEGRKINLRENYLEDDQKKFLEELNFEYDNGFGGQNLFGTIWYVDGTWSSRGEYDGSEWWEHKQIPKIPKELK